MINLNINELLEEVNEKKTFLEKLNLLKDALLNETDHMNLCIIKKNIDYYRYYSVDLITRIKESDDDAFNELLTIKDVRNFIYHYAYHIEKYHRFRYKLADIVNEIKMNIFYHLKRNYRIYDEPHEISLLINSMRKWIKQKTSEGLKSTYKPKNDDYISEFYIEDTSYDESESHVRDLIKDQLTKEELEIFEMKFFMDMRYEDIAKEVGKSRATCQRIFENKIKQKLKESLGEKKRWG